MLDLKRVKGYIDLGFSKEEALEMVKEEAAEETKSQPEKLEPEKADPKPEILTRDDIEKIVNDIYLKNVTSSSAAKVDPDRSALDTMQDIFGKAASE